MKKKISSYQRQTDLLDKMSQTERYVNNLAGISYIVLPKVYPGGTDSLLLCDCMDINKGDEVLDIGTGTGIVALKAKTLGARNVMAIDLSPRAVSNVKQNAKYLGLKIDIKLTSVFGGIKKSLMSLPLIRHILIGKQKRIIKYVFGIRATLLLSCFLMS